MCRTLVNTPDAFAAERDDSCLLVCEAIGGYEDALLAAGCHAPHPHQSGTTERCRRTRGGRPEIKRDFFMAAQTAARFNPVLNETYTRLRKAGKKPIVAIVAIMRRLIVIAHARLRDAFADQMKLS